MAEETLTVLEKPIKSGGSLAVEECIRKVLSEPDATDDAFAELYNGIPMGSGSVEAHYQRARRYRQAAYGVTIFEVGKTALPRMIERLERHGSLELPEGNGLAYYKARDRGESDSSSPPFHDAYDRALSGAFWLVDSAQLVLKEMEDSVHPMHRLGKHLEAATVEYYEMLWAWKEGAGKNRWPDGHGINEYDSGYYNVVNALRENIGVGLNVMSARVISHLIYSNPDAGIAELSRMMTRSIPQISWMASTDRHLGWSADWRGREKKGEPIFTTPLQGVKALLQTPTSRITEPNEFDASIEGHAVMKNAEFCPHRIIKDGPVVRAAMCAGDQWAHYPDPGDRQVAEDFFNLLGIEIQNGYFNFASVALVMGASLLRTTVMPVYAANRQREQADSVIT